MLREIGKNRQEGGRNRKDMVVPEIWRQLK
jgi:hypothetical protein